MKKKEKIAPRKIKVSKTILGIFLILKNQNKIVEIKAVRFIVWLNQKKLNSFLFSKIVQRNSEKISPRKFRAK